MKLPGKERMWKAFFPPGGELIFAILSIEPRQEWRGPLVSRHSFACCCRGEKLFLRLLLIINLPSSRRLTSGQILLFSYFLVVRFKCSDDENSRLSLFDNLRSSSAVIGLALKTDFMFRINAEFSQLAKHSGGKVLHMWWCRSIGSQSINCCWLKKFQSLLSLSSKPNRDVIRRVGFDVQVALTIYRQWNWMNETTHSLKSTHDSRECL